MPPLHTVCKRGPAGIRGPRRRPVVLLPDAGKVRGRLGVHEARCRAILRPEHEDLIRLRNPALNGAPGIEPGRNLALDVGDVEAARRLFLQFSQDRPEFRPVPFIATLVPLVAASRLAKATSASMRSRSCALVEAFARAMNAGDVAIVAMIGDMKGTYKGTDFFVKRDGR